MLMSLFDEERGNRQGIKDSAALCYQKIQTINNWLHVFSKTAEFASQIDKKWMKNFHYHWHTPNEGDSEGDRVSWNFEKKSYTDDGAIVFKNAYCE